MRALAILALLLAAAPAHAQTGEPSVGVTEASPDSTEPPAPVVTEPDEGAPAAVVEAEPAEGAPTTTASGVLGVVTILGAVGTVTGMGIWIERADVLGACEGYATEDPPRFGCLNTRAIREQRDVGIGLTIGFGALALATGIAWAVVVAGTPPAEPTQATVSCGPGLFSFACAGRF